MQTANEKQPDAVEQCNLDCFTKCGCTCRPAPHTTCDMHMTHDELMAELDND